MRRSEKLTATALNRMLREPPDGDVWDTEIPGYHVRPYKRGLSLRFAYRGLNGRNTAVTIGRYGVVTATVARDLARQHAATVAQRGDPREIQAAARAAAVKAQQQTIRAYLESTYRQYQETHKRDGKATVNRIRRQFASLLDRPMGSLSHEDVVKWQAEQLAGGLAFETLKRSYGGLRTMLNRAVIDGVIEANPLAGTGLERPAMTGDALEAAGTERRWLEGREVAALLTALELYQERKRRKRRSSREHGKSHLPDLDAVRFVDFVVPFTLTMLLTGFRPGDLHGLLWQHVDLKRRHIRKVIEKTAHQKPDPQTFPLAQRATEVLTDWWEQSGVPATGYVFPGRTGGRLSSTVMRKPWRLLKALSAQHVAVHGGVQLPDVDLYTLRHHFASSLLMSGADLLTVSRLMGHASIEITAKHYGHLAQDHSRALVEKFSHAIDFPETHLRSIKATHKHN
ncbi:integrase family protein [Afifella aestuarii]|uniref:integrase family protein n=1 Tax=Afifella aestuarii TaxID=1909496 RepID=UPI000FE3DA02|nr:integrase family protein [Afifella aestuarii]